VTKPARKPVRPESAFRIVGKRYPRLVARIQGLIEESEKAFAGNAPESEGSYLWEHTVHVASLAFKLAEEERRDPLLAAITALFHDAGKFAGGRYHADDTAEEAAAARLAEPLLKRSRVPAADRASILSALGAIYKENSGPHPLADIVHDADFLSKFGFLGVAQFFIKSTLRGRTLQTAVMNSLSKELTYAACLPLNMRTRAGRAMAARKSEDTLGFYAGLLRELKDGHGLDFRVETLRLLLPDRPRRTIEIKLVLPAACAACGGKWTVRPEVVPGKKCRTLKAAVVCRGCGASQEISFCLPELAVR
jgi:HD superfamily phosphodiesterase